MEHGDMSDSNKDGRGEKLFRFQDLEIWKKAIEIGDKLFNIADDLEESFIDSQSK